MFLFKGDGCKNYTFLNVKDRSQGTPLLPQNGSDNNLVTGWYRFQGAAGDCMLDKCAVRWCCGTKLTGWLKGTHQTVHDGEVTREVCYAGTGQTLCCGTERQIKVKNCTGYYVFKLKKTLYNARHCGNAGTGKLY